MFIFISFKICLLNVFKLVIYHHEYIQFEQTKYELQENLFPQCFKKVAIHKLITLFKSGFQRQGSQHCYLENHPRTGQRKMMMLMIHIVTNNPNIRV